MIFALLFVAVQADKATGNHKKLYNNVLYGKKEYRLENAESLGVPAPLKNILVALKQKNNGEEV